MTNLPPSRPDLRVRTVSLTVEALPDGRYRVSTPHARGWAAVVDTQGTLAKAVTVDAFNEVTIASYARAKNAPYDLDALTERVPGDPLAATPRARQRSGPRGRSKVHHPGDWAKFEDGNWRSPAGRTYRPGSKQVQAVIRARLERGMTV